MAKRTYQEKLANINAWVEITNYHWHRLQGELHNDEEFWEHTFGSMSDQDWWDWCDIEPSLRIQYEQEYRRWHKLDQGTQDIKKRLMLGKPLYRKDQKNANRDVFRAWMNVKDFVNDINGTPTVDYTTVKITPAEPVKVQVFHNLFEFDY